MMLSVFSAAVFFCTAASFLSGDAVLGHGEHIYGNRYVFHADFSNEKVRDVSALVSHKCRFQSKSWWMNRNSYVIYRHGASERTMLNGVLWIAASVNHKKAYGEILAEARVPDGEWRALGTMPHHDSRRFEIPSDMFPAKSIEIRLRGEKSCSLQVRKYQFSAELHGAADMAADYGVWGVSSGVKVRRRGPLDIKTKKLVVRAAANEADAGQIVAVPKSDVQDMRVAIGRLVCRENGLELPLDSVRVLRVEYVPVEIASDWKGAPGLWPDPLPPQDSNTFPVKAGCNQPFWVLVKVPKGTPKGIYSGELKVSGMDCASLPLEVEVFGFELPDVMTCKTVFGFKPHYSAYWYQRPRTSEQRRDLVMRYYQFMSDHHMSPGVISHFAKKEPKKEGVLDWRKWDVETEKLLKRFHFNTLRIGISGLGGGNQFRRREPVFQGIPATNENYHVRMGKYLGEIERHLRGKGWLDMSYVYWYDEPGEKDYPFVRKGFETLKRHAPGLKGMITKQPSEALLGCVDIWCPQPQRLHLEWAAPARRRGDEFWWYVCNNPPAPYVGEAIDHPGPEMRMWLWQTWGENVMGILLWRSALWNSSLAYPEKDRLQNPYRDAMTWHDSNSLVKGVKIPTVNGEARLMYPPKSCFKEDGSLVDGPVIEDPVSSIRAEHLRDGIEDYEYFAMLRRLNPENPLLKVPKDVYSTLESYAEDTVAIEKHRLALAREIERILKRKSDEPECSIP